MGKEANFAKFSDIFCFIFYLQVRSRFKAGFNEVKKHYYDDNGHVDENDAGDENDDENATQGEEAQPVSRAWQV